VSGEYRTCMSVAQAYCAGLSSNFIASCKSK
jgi:hypothetical protein